MAELLYKTALIVGAGPGISASLARSLSSHGVRVGLAARNIDKLKALADQTGAALFSADAADPAQVEALFEDATEKLGDIDAVIYNASGRLRGPLAELDPELVRKALDVSAFGAFLVVRQAARRMVPRGHGAILLTGATAGLKGFAQSAPFAMGKFALRGLAQSAARELGPKNIHVAHIVIDGVVRAGGQADEGDARLDPDAIAQTYLDILRQPRSAWAHEVDLRPWTETF